MVSKEQRLDAGLKAIADSTRRAILALLRGRQLSVLEIAEEFPMSRPAISKHLRILKQAGLVLETPAGRQRLYALKSDPLEELTGWLGGFGGSGSTATKAGRSTAASQAAHRRRPRPAGSASAAESWRVW